MSNGKRRFHGFSKRFGRKKRKLEKEKELLKVNEGDKNKQKKSYKDIDSGQTFLLSSDESENTTREGGKSVSIGAEGDFHNNRENLPEKNFPEGIMGSEKSNSMNSRSSLGYSKKGDGRDTGDTKINKSKNLKPDTEKVIFKPKKSKYLFRIIWIVFLSFISVLLAGYALIAMNDMLGIGESDNAVIVDIPKDASLDTVASILKNNGIIRQDIFFKIYAFATKNSKGFLEGSYELKPNMDYQIILNKIKSRTVNQDVIELAFREGMSLQECAKLLSENGVCDKDEFLEKCKSDEFDDKYDFLEEIKNKEQRYYKLEGYLFPDTYEFYKDENPSSVIRRFLSNFQKKIIKVNSHEGYDKKTSIKHLCDESGKTLDEVINISAMIQAEAADKTDMYRISSVIRNRLDTVSSDGKNKFGEYGLSRLGIDSTVWYPYKTKGDVPEDIVKDFHSRYDTYEITALPPGPICNPGMQAIYAALRPDDTEFYYFCHSSSGEAYYAKTNDVHLENLKKAGLV